MDGHTDKLVHNLCYFEWRHSHGESAWSACWTWIERITVTDEHVNRYKDGKTVLNQQLLKKNKGLIDGIPSGEPGGGGGGLGLGLHEAAVP